MNEDEARRAQGHRARVACPSAASHPPMLLSIDVHVEVYMSRAEEESRPGDVAVGPPWTPRRDAALTNWPHLPTVEPLIAQDQLDGSTTSTPLPYPDAALTKPSLLPEEVSTLPNERERKRDKERGRVGTWTDEPRDQSGGRPMRLPARARPLAAASRWACLGTPGPLKSLIEERSKLIIPICACRVPRATEAMSDLA